VPPAHAWPAPLKAWVAKCFSLCTTSLERTSMQKQVKDKVEEAAEVGEMFTRDWACEPVPSRGTSKDRRRQMEGEQLKREAEERAGRSLGEERHGDRYADRRNDRGGDRYADPTLTLTLTPALALALALSLTGTATVAATGMVTVTMTATATATGGE
jgi:hypothetical protein